MRQRSIPIATLLLLTPAMLIAAEEPKAPAPPTTQVAAAPAAATAPPAPAQKPLTVGPYRGAEIGEFGILVHITKDQREKGLKYLPAVPKDRGMVWFYKDKSPALFDTRDYLVKVDLVFIGADGKIQKILTAEPVQPAPPAPPPAAPAQGEPKPAPIPAWTVKGLIPAGDVEKVSAELPHTKFVVALGEGEGERFAKAWKPSMTKRFLNADRNHRVWGFSNR